MAATSLSPRRQLMELEEAATAAATDDLSCFFALLPPPLSSSSALPSYIGAVACPAGAQKPRPQIAASRPALASQPHGIAYSPPPASFVSPRTSLGSMTTPLATITAPLVPNTASQLEYASPTPPDRPVQSQPAQSVLPTAPSSALLASASTSSAAVAPAIPELLQAQQMEAIRERSKGPKATYNRSYVRGFARPPPPPGTTDTAATADTTPASTPTSLPPAVLLAPEDDPTSNQYQAPIYRQALSLAQLLDICSDPLILSSLPTPGVHVTRLTGAGKPRDYVMYRCSVCGKEVGDKSKHKKHEASCKKRIIRMLNTAEKEEESGRNASTPTEGQNGSGQGEEAKGKEEKRRKKAAAASPVTGSSLTAAPALTCRGVELVSGKSRVQAVEKSEVYQSELKKQLKWIWHTMDVSPATCLLSRDSVLSRIDLAQMFSSTADGLDIVGLLDDEERESLMQHLPPVDQIAALQQRAPDNQREFPPPRKEFVESALRSTLSSPTFLRSLDEYKEMLMGGSLDPALKGLRMMAVARQRRQQREAAPNKPVEQRVYWGEKLSEIKVNVSKAAASRGGRSGLGGWRGLLGKKHRAVPAEPASILVEMAEEKRDDGADDSNSERDVRRAVVKQEDGEQKSDRTESDTDTDTHDADEEAVDERLSASEDEAGESEVEEEDSAVSEEDERHNDPRSTKGGRLKLSLHRTQRRRSVILSASTRGRRGSAPRSSRARERSSDDEHSSDSSPPSPSPFHIDTLLPFPLQLKLAPASLPDMVPSIQRFHMRSPRFRRVRFARFVLKDGRSSLIDARGVTSSSSASSPTASRHSSPAQKRRGVSDTLSQAATPVNFSHLPRSVAEQCRQLQRQMLSPEEKRAVQQRMKLAKSPRVRQAEQDRLDAAQEAEARMLQLVEAEAMSEKKNGSSQAAAGRNGSAGGARAKSAKRDREEAERQQRVAHGMKRPRGVYDNGAAEESENSASGEEEDEDREARVKEEEQDEASEVETAENGSMDAHRAQHSEQSDGSSTEDDKPLSSILASKMSHLSPTSDSDDVEASEQSQTEQPKAETHLFTPVFARGKFGFSTFVKQAGGNSVAWQ